MRFPLGRMLLGAIASLAWLSVSYLAACGSFTSADARDLPDGNDGPPAMAPDADADAGADTAPTDADAAAHGSGCASEGGIFCDDFEAPALDPRWTPLGQPVATAALSTAAAHSGKKSLGVEVQPTAASNQSIAVALAPSQDPLVVRFWVHVPSSGWAAGESAEIASLRNDLPAGRVSIIATIANANVSLDFRSQTPGQTSTLSQVVSFPMDSWACLRIHLDTARTWLQGPTTQTSPTEGPPIVSSLSLGLAWIGTGSGALSPRRAFFDDVAIGSTDPGCPP